MTPTTPFTFSVRVKADQGASYGAIRNAGGNYWNSASVDAQALWEIQLDKSLEVGAHQIFLRLLNSDSTPASEEVKLGGLYMGKNGQLALSVPSFLSRSLSSTFDSVSPREKIY